MKFSFFRYFFRIIILVVASSCMSPEQNTNSEKLFTSISSESSGVDFINKIEESEDFHYYNYIYAYNGGGVASGDLNNDGFIDLVFTSTQKGISIYLNQGGLTFKDITVPSGIKNPEGFYSGVTLTDINQDGFLDIYICRAGWYEEESKLSNLLYINNGDLTFSEKAKEHGLADSNRSITSVFFDYDKDGDLDAYVSNSPVVTRDFRTIFELDSIKYDPNTIALKGSDRFYRNNGEGFFTDISEEARIYPERGFALNALAGDLNGDGWMDIYVSNDFETPDFAFLNNKDGSFTESREDLVKHMSFYSMGSDLADINNDGLKDIMVLDMIPEDYVRSKTTMAATTFDKHQQMIHKGYGHQYMHNVLQLNNGNGTYSEISYLAGITNTDWSWSTLLADFDLDGYNDIYITNGVFRDVIDQDATKSIIDIMRRNKRRPTNADFLAYTKMLPQQKMINYFYKNMGDLSFENYSTNWVDSLSTFSNGSTYADLDNDGDLDIVVNNIDEEATILRNNSQKLTDNHYVEIDFIGSPKNKFGVGAEANLYFDNGTRQIRQHINSRGYLSAVSNRLHFGLGKEAFIPKIEIIWPDGKKQELRNLQADTTLTVNYNDAIEDFNISQEVKITLFTPVLFLGSHKDSDYDDYQKQFLLPHKLSQTGPCVAKSDINKDGFEDVFIGGANGYPGKLYLGQTSGNFKETKNYDFIADKQYEDVGACFFDVDSDGDDDLYVVSGSYEFNEASPLLQDRLYLNNGNGKFKKSIDALPEFRSSGSVVISSDYDRDGDVDLFVGGRVIPGAYPHSATSYLLINTNGKFSIASDSLAPELAHIGMVTCAQWSDIDGDGDSDLIASGEWMGIEVFVNESGKLVRSQTFQKLSSTTGWWNEIFIADINEDGVKDIVAGNLGSNFRYQASTQKPFHIYTSDFDFNGIEDIILAEYDKDRLVPVKSRGPLVMQIPHLANKISNNKEFASLDLSEIVGPRLESALHYQAIEFRSGIFMSNKGEGFDFVPFSNEMQKSPINSIIYSDLDGDEINDLLMAGNNYLSEYETTRADAGTGFFLKGKENGDFDYIPNSKSGFFANKDVRKMILINSQKGKQVMVINNDDAHDLFRVNN